MRMETNNRKLAIFLVPNGQGGFRRESYYVRKEVGGGVSSRITDKYPLFGINSFGFEGKTAKNSIQKADLLMSR